MHEPFIGVMSGVLLGTFWLCLAGGIQQRRGPHMGVAYATLAAGFAIDGALACYDIGSAADSFARSNAADSLRLTLRLEGLLVFCQMARVFGVAQGLGMAIAACVAALLALVCAGAPGHAGAWQASLAGAFALACLAQVIEWRLGRWRQRAVQHRLAWAGVLSVGVLLTIRSVEIHGGEPGYSQIAADLALAAVTGLLSLPRRRHAARAPAGGVGPVPGRRPGIVELALEQQRSRIAQDLHDGVGAHLLSVIARQPNRTLSERETVEALETCMLELRIAVDQLVDSHESLLSSMGMVRYRVQPALDRLGIHLTWSMDERENPTRLSPPHTREVLLILQEALSNVLRHSQASVVKVALDYSRTGFMLLEIEDNGRGIQGLTPDESGSCVAVGRGLQNLRERSKRLGAELEMQSSVGGGTRLRLTLPL